MRPNRFAFSSHFSDWLRSFLVSLVSFMALLIKSLSRFICINSSSFIGMCLLSSAARASLISGSDSNLWFDRYRDLGIIEYPFSGEIGLCSKLTWPIPFDIGFLGCRISLISSLCFSSEGEGMKSFLMTCAYYSLLLCIFARYFVFTSSSSFFCFA